MKDLLDHLHNDIVLKVLPIAANVPVHLVYIGGLLLASVLVILWMTLVAMGWIWAERRVAGFIQARVGPNRVGPYGLLQSLADGIKLLVKEDIIPTAANRFLYELAPLLVFAGAFIPFVVLPFSQHLLIADMDLGVFYVLAFGALEVVGILMAGWAPNSKWSLYGGMRLAAQMLSYEIPLGLSVLTVVILAGSLNFNEIIAWQTRGVLFNESWDTPWILDWLNWAVFRSPAAFVAFFIFYIAALAETKRAPFDLPEAESELVAGFHTEYTGIRFSYFFLSEYCAMYVVAAMGAILFLGGWHWPLPTWDVPKPGFIAAVAAGLGEIDYSELGLFARLKLFLANALWHGPRETVEAFFQPATLKFVLVETFGFANLVGKAFVLLFVMLWIRWTLPRVRIDQVMHLCLKVLLPIGLACVLLAGVQAALLSPRPAEPAAAVVPAAPVEPEPMPAVPPQAEPDADMSPARADEAT